MSSEKFLTVDQSTYCVHDISVKELLGCIPCVLRSAGDEMWRG